MGEGDSGPCGGGGLAWKFPIPAAVSATRAKLSVDNKDLDESDKSSPLVAKTGGPGLVVVDGPNPDNETYTVTLRPGAGIWTSVGLEVDTDASLAGADISRGSDRFVISEIDAACSPDGRRAARKPRSSWPIAACPQPSASPRWPFSMTIQKLVLEL